MRDVASKRVTLRTARAVAYLKVSPLTLERVKRKEVEKGDPVEATRIAAFMAVKNASHLLPFCHPIPIEHIRCHITLSEERIAIEVEVKSIARTGCEMEALTGATLGALCLYDMLKPYDETMVIEGIQLLEKRGGKSQYRDLPPQGLKAGVLVISDSVARGKKEDKAGKIIVDALKDHGVGEITYRVVPDEPVMIQKEILSFCESGHRLILTSGGTGLSPRDQTPEAVRELLEREIPGVILASLLYGGERTPYAFLSRGVAGVRGDTLIVTLPGSSRGAKEAMEALFPWLFHIYPVLGGGQHEPQPQSSRGEKS